MLNIKAFTNGKENGKESLRFLLTAKAKKTQIQICEGKKRKTREQNGNGKIGEEKCSVV